MRSLRIERAGARERFRFTLEGIIDPQGARALDRLLFECQARGARAVHLDFRRVTSICTLGTSVLARQSRVYEDTERRIHVTGLGPEIRAALQPVDAILYEANAPEPKAETAPVEDPPAAEPAAETPAAPPAAETSAANTAELHVLQSALKRKLVEFRNLFEITRALNLAPDLDEVLGLFGLTVMGQFGVERLAVFLAEPRRGGVLVPRLVRGFPPDHFRGFDLSPALFAEGPEQTVFFSLGAAPAEESLEALRASGIEWGVMLRVGRALEGVALLGRRVAGRGFREDERDLLTIFARQAAVAVANTRHLRAQEDRNLGLVRGMMSLIESRDPYARGGTERAVRYVTAVARLLEVPKPALKSLIYGTLLRDIGMLTVSHLVLKNPAHLSDEEWSVIRQHPVRGARILEEMEFPPEVVGTVRHHHERWGGEGYPDGLRGEAIPLGARIVALVDSYVAMTAERPYRRALTFEKARQVVAENWGSPFDPAIVKVFLEVLEKAERRSRQRLTSLDTRSATSAPGGEGPSDGRDADQPVETRP